MSEREKRLREYEEARRRQEAARADGPYKARRMRVRMPFGCVVAVALAVLASAAALLVLLRDALRR